MHVAEADKVLLGEPIVVTLAGREFAIQPPTVRAVRRFRLGLLRLQAACENAVKALKEAQAGGDLDAVPELAEAVRVAEDAMVDAVLCTVPEIAAVYEELLDTPSPTLAEELQEAFHLVHGWYLDPLARRLAATMRAQLRAPMKTVPAKKVNSSSSSCEGSESASTSSSATGPMPSSDLSCAASG